MEADDIITSVECAECGHSNEIKKGEIYGYTGFDGSRCKNCGATNLLEKDLKPNYKHEDFLLTEKQVNAIVQEIRNACADAKYKFCVKGGACGKKDFQIYAYKKKWDNSGHEAMFESIIDHFMYNLRHVKVGGLGADGLLKSQRNSNKAYLIKLIETIRDLCESKEIDNSPFSMIINSIDPEIKSILKSYIHAYGIKSILFQDEIDMSLAIEDCAVAFEKHMNDIMIDARPIELPDDWNLEYRSIYWGL